MLTMEDHPMGIFRRLQTPAGQVLTGAPPGFPVQQQTLCNFRPAEDIDSDSDCDDESETRFPHISRQRNDSDGRRLQTPAGQVLTGAPPGFPVQQQTLCKTISRPLFVEDGDSDSECHEESKAQFPQNDRQRKDSDGYLSSGESSSCSEKFYAEMLQKLPPPPPPIPNIAKMMSCNDLENALRGKATDDLKTDDALNGTSKWRPEGPLYVIHHQQKGLGSEDIEKENKEKHSVKQQFEEKESHLTFLGSPSTSAQKLQTPDFYTGRPLLLNGLNGSLLPSPNNPIPRSNRKGGNLMLPPNNFFLCTPDMLLSSKKDSIFPTPQSSVSSSPSDSFLPSPSVPPSPKGLLLPSPTGQFPSPKSPILPPPGFGNHQPMRGSIYMPQIQSPLTPTSLIQSQPQSPSQPQPQPWSPALQSTRHQQYQYAWLQHQREFFEFQTQQQLLHEKIQKMPKEQLQRQLRNPRQPNQQQQELSTKDVIRKLQTLALRVKNVETNCITQIQNLENIEMDVLQNNTKKSKRQKLKEKKKRARERKEGLISDELGNEPDAGDPSLKNEDENVNDPASLKKKKKKKKKNKSTSEDQNEGDNKDDQIFKPGIFSKCELSNDGDILKKGQCISNIESFALKKEQVLLKREQETQKKQHSSKKEPDLQNRDATQTTPTKKSDKKDEQIFKPGIFSKRDVCSHGDVLKKRQCIPNIESIALKKEQILLKREQETQKKQNSSKKEPDLMNKGATQTTPEKKRPRRSKKGDDNFEDYLPLAVVKERIHNKTLIEGEFRINAKNHLEAFVTDPETGCDILILGLLDRNRALEGDIVAIEIKDEEYWLNQKNGTIVRTGKVVHILERVHHCHTVGSLRLQKGFFFLVSRDSRFPLLRIPTISLPKTILSEFKEDVKESSQLFKALLLSWNIPRYANGMIKEAMGKKGTIDVETTAIFAELGLDKNPISQAFNKFLPKLPYMISGEEISSRLDLRSEVIFTIDPATARDLDDAVSVKVLTDGEYEVGVHISDVTHFLTQGTPLDVEVSERATTVYMVERAYHMLPIELCGLCSLVPGEDKLALSVIFKLDEEGNVLDTKFSRTVINSCAQLSYDHAQAFIEGEENIELPVIYNDIQVSTIKDAILCLNKIAVNRRTRRFNTGALKIDQPKVCFDIDSDCNPQSMFIYELKDSHRLIEEFMLLANEAVATYLHSKVPDIALLRRHEPPKAEMMNKLAKSLQKLEIFLDLSSAGALHQTLTKYTDDDIMRASVLNQLCAKPMNRAVYFCSDDDTHHYALNLEKYTHFTSPIRRYADIVVHRLLTACLGYSELPPWTKQDVRKFASTSNRKKWAAKRAGEMSSNVFRLMYIKRVGEVVADAVVTWVNSRSVDTHVPSMALNIRVYVDRLTYEYNENDIGSTLVLKWPRVNSPQVLRVFSPIKLRLKYSEKLDNIEAKVVPPPPDAEVNPSESDGILDPQN